MSPSLIGTTRRVRPTLLALSVALACAGSPEDAAPVAESATPIRLAPVASATDNVTITAVGTWGARDEVALSFKIGGIVARVLVDQGATVRRGQALAQLDQREIDALLAKATIGVDKARRDAARVERLFRDSVATIAQWQDAQSARDAAEADLRAAQVNHEYATIVAPTDGVVLRRQANPGQLVGPGAPVLDFASRGRGQVMRVGLPDRDAVRVRVGATATATFDAMPGRTFRGSVVLVGADADPRTGTWEVQVRLDGAGDLPSGLVGRVSLAASPARGTAGARGVAAIPAEALVEGDGQAGVVYTVDADGTRARRVPVTLVGVEGTHVLVRGLEGIAQVVTAGATWLTDSARVEVKR
ncbi:MAG: efflux RND transporter periplasmic adaptor subunit [Gemmatimonadetes bacterium]|nr:efflux RND transporter periplasmic adaptor subunit [Gemmatimonadota bacterium]